MAIFEPEYQTALAVVYAGGIILYIENPFNISPV
jgi:hypothetical protein